MSSNEDIDAGPPRQQHSSTNLQIDHRTEFYRLGCVVLRLIIIAVTETCARNWGRRLEMISQAAWIPKDGYGNTEAVAALMNMDPRGVREMGTRNGVPILKPGNERIYHFPDLVKKFEKPDPGTLKTPELPTNEYQKPTTGKRKRSK